MGVNRTEQTLSSRKATNSRVAPLRGATLGGWLLLMIDSIYHMKLELIKNLIFGLKTSRFCDLLRNVIMDITTLCYLSVNH